MVKVFIDTEFTDLIQPGLISFGAVTQQGDEFYAEVSDFKRELASDFTKSFVIPILNLEQHGHPEYVVSEKLWSFFLALPWRNSEELEIVVTNRDDWDLMLELFDMKLPYNVSKTPRYVSIDLETKATLNAMKYGIKNINSLTRLAVKEYTLGFLDYFFETKAPQHHALHDARAIKCGYERADRYLEETRVVS